MLKKIKEQKKTLIFNLKTIDEFIVLNTKFIATEKVYYRHKT